MATNLTDLAIKNAKARGKLYTMAAGKGLTLLVTAAGAKYWRLRYRFGGRARWVSVGSPYPATSLKTAEAEAFRLRALLQSGIDPADEKARARAALRESIANTFGQAAEAWHAFRSKVWDAETSEQAAEYLARDLLPRLAKRPIESITPRDLIAILRSIENRGAFNVAVKVRQWLKAIFSFARANGWTNNDPARDLAAVAERGPKSKNYAHLSAEELPDFIRALDAYQGSVIVKACAWMAMWTANRPGITRTLRWSELDLDKELWTIEKGRKGMKRGYRHLTPLPTQALSLLKEIQQISGHLEFVFIGRNDPRKPISDGAIAGMIKAIGYRNKQTMHGFRHMISTALNEKGHSRDWIERQLAHGDPDKIRDVYNKAQYLEQRREMMQAWADHLDRLRDVQSRESI